MINFVLIHYSLKNAVYIYGLFALNKSDNHIFGTILILHKFHIPFPPNEQNKKYMYHHVFMQWVYTHVSEFDKPSS